jgi:hypothetical protein
LVPAETGEKSSQCIVQPDDDDSCIKVSLAVRDVMLQLFQLDRNRGAVRHHDALMGREVAPQFEREALYQLAVAFLPMGPAIDWLPRAALVWLPFGHRIRDVVSASEVLPERSTDSNHPPKSKAFQCEAAAASAHARLTDEKRQHHL